MYVQKQVVYILDKVLFSIETSPPGNDGDNATASVNSVSTSLDIVSIFFNWSIVSLVYDLG